MRYKRKNLLNELNDGTEKMKNSPRIESIISFSKYLFFFFLNELVENLLSRRFQ